MKRLQNIEPAEWRLRVGKWRVRFAYDATDGVLRVRAVLSRAEAYR